MKDIIADKKLGSIFFRCLAAFLAAVLLFAITGFAFVSFIRGPEEISNITEDTAGKYVTANIDVIFGYYAESGVNSSGEAKARFALIPSGGKFVTVQLPERYFESADVILDTTYDVINGYSLTLDKYFTVTGSVRELDSAADELLHEWLALNSTWMTEAGIIGSGEDYGELVSNLVFNVDYYGGMSSVWAYTLTIIGALALLYALSMAVLLAYKVNAKKKLEPASGPVEDSGADEDELWLDGMLKGSSKSEAKDENTKPDEDKEPDGESESDEDEGPVDDTEPDEEDEPDDDAELGEDEYVESDDDAEDA